MTLKYSKELKDFGCNTSGLNQIERKNVIHFVFDPISDSRNFVPVYISDINREKVTCAGFALSFYETFMQAQTRIATFTMSKKNIYKKIGTHYAQGDISLNDGLSDNVDKNGHFNLYTFNDIDLRIKFTIIGNII